MKVSSNQQASIKSIILIFIILVLSTATAVYGGCTGTFGDISGYAGNVETSLTIVCDYETAVTVEKYYMATVYGYNYQTITTDITATSPSPLTFTVSPGTSATFIVPGQGCVSQVFYEAHAKVWIGTSYLSAHTKSMRPISGC